MKYSWVKKHLKEPNDYFYTNQSLLSYKKKSACRESENNMLYT